MPCSFLLAQNMPTAEQAAVRLTNEAFQRGSNDNISCIVVNFKFGEPGAAAAAGNAPSAASAPSASGLDPAV